MGARDSQPEPAAADTGEACSEAEEQARCRFCGCLLCSAEDHAGLCANLERHGLLTPGSPLARAFRAVDRGDFVPQPCDGEAPGLAYVDAAVYLDFGAQISAPHVHAHALRLLFQGLARASPPPAPGELAERRLEPLRALDLGSGSGFACAVLARLLEILRPGCPESHVLAVEHIPELADRAGANLARGHGELLASGRLRLRCADGRRLLQQEPGLKGRFDVVHCGCALAPGEEQWLLPALVPGGRAVFPRGQADEPQRLCVAEEGPGGEWRVSETAVAVLYVPATSESEQRARGDAWEEVVARCQRNAAALVGQPQP